MKSLKIKIIILVLGCVILSSIAIGMTSFWNAQRVVKDDSTKIMNLLCENKSANLNQIFKRIEQSVETLGTYTTHDIIDIEAFASNQQNVDEFSQRITSTAIDAAMNTEGAITVYIRFEPSLSNTKSGIFYVKDQTTAQFYRKETTDLSLYEEDDIENVGWFYEAKKVNAPVWLSPYYNENIDKQIISYVVPIYVNEQFLGIVGMDIDFNLLKSIVSETNVYKSGYAFLSNNKAEIVYHKSIQAGTNLINYNNGEFKNMATALLEKSTNSNELITYHYDGSEKEATYRSLENGMRFILTAPKSEIDAQLNKLLFQIILGMLIFVSITIVLTIIFARRLVKPLQELTIAAKQVAEGNLDIQVYHHSNDEVGELSDSFRQTVTQLNQYFTRINNLAYTDSLTSVRNKTSYMEAVTNINDKINEHTAYFSVIVFDLNGLKVVNDRWGHQAGDTLIIHATQLICSIFKKFPVFRIGGDEFVVIMEDDTYQEQDALHQKFVKEMLESESIHNGNIQLSIASGIAHYNVDEDWKYGDVFKKADDAMYSCKAEMKGF